MRAAPVVDQSPRPFVGRRLALTRLGRLLEEATTGRPGRVVVEGPPGIGKTALVHRFINATAHACILHGSGEEAEANLPFGVLAQLATASPVSPLPGTIATVPRGRTSPPDPLMAGASLLDLLGEIQHQTDGRPCWSSTMPTGLTAPRCMHSPSHCGDSAPTGYSPWSCSVT